MRKRIFEIIEVGNEQDLASRIYDWFIMAVIIISIVPLTIKTTSLPTEIIDRVTVSIFIIDYILRLLTADLKLGKKGWSFIKYPFTVMAIIDLLSILPSFILVSKSFKLLKIARLLRTFRVFRVFKGFRYSKNIDIIIRVFKRQKASLSIVGVLAVGYIIVTALVIFNIEPDTFNTFFDAIYWATVSLTTVGYGDIYATTITGQVITMISALFGIAIVALPAGIITAGYMNEIEEMKKEKKE